MLERGRVAADAFASSRRTRGKRLELAAASAGYGLIRIFVSLDANSYLTAL